MECPGTEGWKFGVEVGSEEIYHGSVEDLEDVVRPRLRKRPLRLSEVSSGQGVRHHVLLTRQVGGSEEDLESPAEMQKVPRLLAKRGGPGSPLPVDVRDSCGIVAKYCETMPPKLVAPVGDCQEHRFHL